MCRRRCKSLKNDCVLSFEMLNLNVSSFCLNYHVTFHHFGANSTSESLSVSFFSPVSHRRALSITVGQGEATFSQVELQAAPLHQPVRRLQDLRGQGLRLIPLLWGLAAPGSRLGHNTPRGGGCLGLLTDAIEVFHRVLPSLTSSGTTTACKHCYLESKAGSDELVVLLFSSVLHLL